MKQFGLLKDGTGEGAGGGDVGGAGAAGGGGWEQDDPTSGGQPDVGLRDAW